MRNVGSTDLLEALPNGSLASLFGRVCTPCVLHKTVIQADAQSFLKCVLSSDSSDRTSFPDRLAKRLRLRPSATSLAPGTSPRHSHSTCHTLPWS